MAQGVAIVPLGVMWKTDLQIDLREEERQALERVSRSLVASHRAVVRARNRVAR